MGLHQHSLNYYAFRVYAVKGNQMMYNQKLVASIKANGKILREFKDTVYIPFGSEYSILLKNLSTVRCIVNVFIDGDNIVPGGLVLGAGQECDLERSIKNGNLTEGNKLKFIERTSAVENGPRGIKLEDGLIRVEYQFEKVYVRPATTIWDYNTGHWGKEEKWKFVHDTHYSPSILRGMSISGQMIGSASSTVTAQSAEPNLMNVAQAPSSNDVGITVPGSKSDQKFSTASWFATEAEKHSIVLKLLGETPDNKPVAKAVTTKHKPKCTTCGKQNKAHAKFCTECGTSLEIFA